MGGMVGGDPVVLSTESELSSALDEGKIKWGRRVGLGSGSGSVLDSGAKTSDMGSVTNAGDRESSGPYTTKPSKGLSLPSTSTSSFTSTTATSETTVAALGKDKYKADPPTISKPKKSKGKGKSKSHSLRRSPTPVMDFLKPPREPDEDEDEDSEDGSKEGEEEGDEMVASEVEGEVVEGVVQREGEGKGGIGYAAGYGMYHNQYPPTLVPTPSTSAPSSSNAYRQPPPPPPPLSFSITSPPHPRPQQQLQQAPIASRPPAPLLQLYHQQVAPPPPGLLRRPQVIVPMQQLDIDLNTNRDLSQPHLIAKPSSPAPALTSLPQSRHPPSASQSPPRPTYQPAPTPEEEICFILDEAAFRPTQPKALAAKGPASSRRSKAYKSGSAGLRSHRGEVSHGGNKDRTGQGKGRGEKAKVIPPPPSPPYDSMQAQGVVGGERQGKKEKRKTKPALACLFCRGRKIACQPPVPGSGDMTCKYVLSP